MANGTPKPLALVQGHRTKAERELREKEEKALTTGEAFKEWDEVKSDAVAHKEFLKLKRMYRAIGKDDVLLETSMNQFCILLSECKKLELLIKKIDIINDMDIYIKLDNKLEQKRRAMFSIEKENLMTLQSIMRSIPKKPTEEASDDPMSKLLSLGRPGR